MSQIGSEVAITTTLKDQVTPGAERLATGLLKLADTVEKLTDLFVGLANKTATLTGSIEKSASKSVETSKKLDQVATATKKVGDESRAAGNKVSDFGSKLDTIGNKALTFVNRVASIATGFISIATAIKSINEFKGDDRAQTRLAASIRSVNVELADRVRFSKQLAEVSIFSDDSIQEAEAVLRDAGVLESQINKALEAAADRASHFGTTIQEQATLLGKTLNEDLPREFKTFDRELANLSDSSRRAGAAIDVIGSKYRGEALRRLATDAGRADQATNKLNDALADVGRSLIRIQTAISVVVTEKLKQLAEFFESDRGRDFLDRVQRVIEFVIKNAELIIGSLVIINGAKGLGGTLAIIKILSPATATWIGATAAGLGLVAVKVAAVTAVVTVLTAAVLETIKKLTGLKVGLIDIQETVGGIQERSKEGFIDLASGTTEFFSFYADKAANATVKVLGAITKAVSLGFVNVDKGVDEFIQDGKDKRNKLIAELAKGPSDVVSKELDRQADERHKQELTRQREILAMNAEGFNELNNRRNELDAKAAQLRKQSELDTLKESFERREVGIEQLAAKMREVQLPPLDKVVDDLIAKIEAVQEQKNKALKDGVDPRPFYTELANLESQLFDATNARATAERGIVGFIKEQISLREQEQKAERDAQKNLTDTRAKIRRQQILEEGRIELDNIRKSVLARQAGLDEYQDALNRIELLPIEDQIEGVRFQVKELQDQSIDALNSLDFVKSAQLLVDLADKETELADLESQRRSILRTILETIQKTREEMDKTAIASRDSMLSAQNELHSRSLIAAGLNEENELFELRIKHIREQNQFVKDGIASLLPELLKVQEAEREAVVQRQQSAQINEAAAKADDVLARSKERLNARLEDVNRATERGSIGVVEAIQKEKEAYIELDQATQAYIATLVELRERSSDPKLFDELTIKIAGAQSDLEEAQNRIEDRWIEFQTKVRDLFTSPIENAFTSLVKGTATVRDAFANLAEGIGDVFIDMAARILANQAVMAVLNLFGGFGGPGNPSPLAQFFSGAFNLAGFAEGGHVPEDGSPNHDTIPAMLTAGEYVLPRNVVRNLGVGFLDFLRMFGASLDLRTLMSKLQAVGFSPMAALVPTMPSPSMGRMMFNSGGPVPRGHRGGGVQVIPIPMDEPTWARSMHGGETILLRTIARNPAKWRGALGIG